MADALRAANVSLLRAGSVGPARDRRQKRTAPQKAAERIFTPLANRPAAEPFCPALLRHRPPKLGGLRVALAYQRLECRPRIQERLNISGIMRKNRLRGCAKPQTRCCASHNGAYATAQDGPQHHHRRSPLRLCSPMRGGAARCPTGPAANSRTPLRWGRKKSANHHRVTPVAITPLGAAPLMMAATCCARLKLQQELANHFRPPLRPAPRERGRRSCFCCGAGGARKSACKRRCEGQGGIPALHPVARRAATRRPKASAKTAMWSSDACVTANATPVR